MANHGSLLDGPILGMIIPRPIRIVLKKSLFRIPILGMAMSYVGFIPVDRQGAKGGQKSMRRAAELMREKGYSFLVFPEGTRSRDGRIQAFRRGGFFLALESGTPIVPVTIDGTFKLMSKGQWHARKGKVRVVFHEPVAVAGYSSSSMGDLMDHVREAIASPGH
jgi:1-acyl-sn-glycerol-3-phosphate acyltransferase